MGLNLYYNNPFTLGSLVDPVDTYTGDGVTTTFKLVAKFSTRLGSTVEFDNIEYYMYNQGFTKGAGNTFTLSSAPPAASQGVAPGTTCLTFAAYDQTSVAGVSNPNLAQIPIYIAADDIQNFQYMPFPGNTGIEIAFVNLITSALVPPQISWVQLACSGNFGAVGTYQSAGTPLVTAGLFTFGQMASATTTTGTNVQITCLTAGNFLVNDYIRLNPGGVNQEDCRINTISIATNTITVDGATYIHAANESFYTCGRLIWALMTIPLNATNGTAASFYNLACRVRATQFSRL